jgi:hypothetical protein
LADPNRIDPERLAALIDGRLGEAEAAEMRAQLAGADADTLAAYADAVALAGADDVRPIASARSARRWLVPAIGALAAGLIAVAVLRLPRDGSSAANVASGLTTRPLDVPEWSAVRSSGAAVTDRGRAVRLGVLLVQYELAARQADSAAASRAAMIAALVEGIPGGSAAAMRWKSVAGGALPQNEQARAVNANVAWSLVDRDFVGLGVWLEAARSAAAANQAEWFDANGATPVARAMAATAMPAERDALAAVERSVRARPLDLDAISAATAAAERVLGR